MASWLVRWASDQAVRVRALSVLLGETLYSHSVHSASLRPGAPMITGKFNAGSNPAMD